MKYIAIERNVYGKIVRFLTVYAKERYYAVKRVREEFKNKIGNFAVVTEREFEKLKGKEVASSEWYEFLKVVM